MGKEGGMDEGRKERATKEEERGRRLIREVMLGEWTHFNGGREV